MAIRACVFVLGVSGLSFVASAQEVLPVLPYQGVLEQNGEPFTGTADIEVRLWDSIVGGSPASTIVTYPDVQFDNGLFSISPNFGGNVYNGERRYIEFKIDGVTLSPRQPLNPAPQATRVTGIQRNDTTGFVGIGRSNRLSMNETFGIFSDVPEGILGGMFVETGPNRSPVYGYSEDSAFSAYHYFDHNTDQWALNVGNTLQGDELRYDTSGELVVPRRVAIGDAQSAFYPLEVRADSSFVIFGESTATTGTGVAGFAEGEFGTGVSGVGNGASSEGIRGVQNGASGWAGRFLGDVQIGNRLTVGTSFASTTTKQNTLYVIDSPNGTASPANHVALIENTSIGTSPDVLALKINSTDPTPGGAINFISFFNDAEDNLGSIQGNGAGSIELGGAGNDYAEWLEQVSASEDIGPGCVVAVRGGKLSLDTSGADQVMVVSTNPIVTGNRPYPDDEGIAGWQRVAFIGQAPVRTRGAVEAGEFLIPSGLHDGTAVAVGGSEIEPEQLMQVLGVAWESSAGTGVREVNAAVGIDQADANSHVLRAQHRRITDLEDRLERLEALFSGDGSGDE